MRAGGCLIPIILYVYLAYSLQAIAKKASAPNPWLAWIPIANIYLMCRIPGKPGWWVILFFLPVVNIVFSIIVWMAIAEKRGKPAWWGILIIIPPVNLIVPGYLAFSD